jgi:hypothetical protein
MKLRLGSDPDAFVLAGVTSVGTMAAVALGVGVLVGMALRGSSR